MGGSIFCGGIRLGGSGLAVELVISVEVGDILRRSIAAGESGLVLGVSGVEGRLGALRPKFLIIPGM